MSVGDRQAEESSWQMQQAWASGAQPYQDYHNACPSYKRAEPCPADGH